MAGIGFTWKLYPGTVETLAMYFVDITCDVQSVVLELGQLHVEFLEEIIEVLSHPILIIVPHPAGESGTSRLVNLAVHVMNMLSTHTSTSLQPYPNDIGFVGPRVLIRDCSIPILVSPAGAILSQQSHLG